MARSASRSSIRSQLIGAREALARSGNHDGWLDAEVLLAHVLDADRSWLHAHPERRLSAVERQRFRRLVQRRIRHAPVAYLVGRREFYGHSLRVSPAVLIPRPETELLVDLAIDWLRSHPAARRVIDLGTGSGAIAIAIAKAVRAVRVVAIDVDPKALAVAAANVAEQRVTTRVRLRRADLLNDARPADLIVANLPYVTAAQLRTAAPELHYEPSLALGAGEDGLDAIRQAMQQAPAALRSGGCLMLECDPGQARRIERLAKTAWPSAAVTIHKDLAGRNRAVMIQTA